jgi:riboflavin kinase/FMN adenylyltransferase
MEADELRSDRIKSIAGESVVTVGTFDGIHIGHRKVLEKVIEKARREDLNSVIVTFDTHPLKVLRPSAAPGLLTTLEEKLKILSHFEVDFIEVIPFNRDFAQLSPRDFIEGVLIQDYLMKELIMGYDHGFGRNREGSVPMLQSIAGEMGFGLSVVSPVQMEGETVSSSRIRKCVGDADFDYVTRTLGRFYSMETTVIRGEGRGKTIGFPTANLEILGQDKLIPPDGVYAVRVLHKGESYAGMLHNGDRPTFSGVEPSVEVHLIGFDGYLQGESLEVQFIGWIREIKRFSGSEELKEQLLKDREVVKQIYPEE